MKIKKQVLAWGLVAGLAGVSGAAAHEGSSLDAQFEAGYLLAKLATDGFDASETTAGVMQAATQAAGSVSGGAAAAWAGAKIGGKIGAVVGGLAGAIAGAAIGAA